MRTLPISLGVIFLAVPVTAQILVTRCEPLRADELTRKGYFETVVFKEQGPFRFVQGIVTFENGTKARKDVFVEIFTGRNTTQNRVAGCKTGEDGRFSIAGLPDGKYVLRLSKDGGFEITDIPFRISAKSKRTMLPNTVVFLGK